MIPNRDSSPRESLRFSTMLRAVLALVFLTGCGGVDVHTYHYDNLRTGWNQNERTLKPANVNAASLHVLSLQLDDPNDQVDAQPLIVRKVRIDGKKHDVVYLATENNSVYAVDADHDTKLKKVTLGPAVPWPIGCGKNGPTVGINGTPVIDLATGTLYVIAYVLDPANGGKPEYYLHALDIATLADKVSPRMVTASRNLNNQQTFNFQATYQRQRPGMLLDNGNVYAGFGSFCDWGGSNSRGWVLGWQAGTLNPLPANDLNNSQSSAPNNMFLSSVWESGYGLAAADGNLYFTTGNSDRSGTTYDGCTNIQESVVRLPGSLLRNCPVTPPDPSLFTPSNVAVLDQNDTDVGAAGVMALPDQSGSVPKLLVSNAKDGSMFLLNRNNLGGFTPANSGALGGVQSIGNGCWCGPTYFNDGSPHIVSSGGNWNSDFQSDNLYLWNVSTSPWPQLIQVASGAMPDITEAPGFFTSVSSHGTKDAIIWAVSRPLTNTEYPSIWLYAFNATPSGNTLQPLFPGVVAGSWPNQGGSANIVPVVANGKVYVASYQELDIFDIKDEKERLAVDRKIALGAAIKPESPGGPEEHRVYGTVRQVQGDQFTMETRDHKMVDVNSTKARAAERYALAAIGNGVSAAGSYDKKGVLQAESVHRVQRHPSTWPEDR